MAETNPLKDVAAAVTGPETPAAAAMVSAPSGKAVLALALAGPALSVMIVGCVWVLAFRFWPDAVGMKALAVMSDMVIAVASIATILALMLGLVVFSLAAGGLKKVEAKAGPGSVMIESGSGG